MIFAIVCRRVLFEFFMQKALKMSEKIRLKNELLEAYRVSSLLY